MNTQVLRADGRIVPGGLLPQFEEYRSVVEALQKADISNALMVQDELQGTITLNMISGVKGEIYTPLVTFSDKEEQNHDIHISLLEDPDIVRTIVAILHRKIDEMIMALLLNNLRNDITEKVCHFLYKIGNYNDAIRILNSR
ncbi:MAG: hypothetical protein Q8K26_04340 [Candidatus Gracilibacteria bacterium]|nr:hypothetical protein [Candidatus Gracilibacteria bacterium]